MCRATASLRQLELTPVSTVATATATAWNISHPSLPTSFKQLSCELAVDSIILVSILHYPSRCSAGSSADSRSQKHQQLHSPSSLSVWPGLEVMGPPRSRRPKRVPPRRRHSCRKAGRDIYPLLLLLWLHLGVHAANDQAGSRNGTAIRESTTTSS